MKKKVLGLLLSISMIATMLVGCGSNSDSGSTDLNTEKQISAKNFTKSVEAFKEFYDEFYEEHRFNGSYEETEDCIANIYMIGGTPVMAILDMLAPSEDYFTADLYLYEYVDKEVQEKAKYSSLRFGDDEIFLYPLQDKLFIGYYDEERNYKVAELDEYFTKSKEEFYIVAEKDYDGIFEKDIEENIETAIHCDDFEEFIEDGIWESFDVETHYNTGLAKENDGGYYLLRESGIETLSFYTYCNYALVLDRRLEGDDYIGCLYSTDFKKYLDYLSEQEITNNVQLLLSHAEYLESIGVSDSSRVNDYWTASNEGKKIDTVVWFDGIYYYILDKVAYPIAYDFGYSEEDLPKKICGYEVENDIVDVLLSLYPSDIDTSSYKKDLSEEFPISNNKRILAKDVWEQVAVAKEEYEQTVGAALEAYEDYLDDNEDYIEREMFRYQLFCLDDNNTPELFLINDFGYSVVYTYYNGELISQDIGSSYFSGKERQGTIYWSDGRDYFYSDTVYKLQDGTFEKVFAGSHEHDWNTETATYHYTKNSEEVYVTIEEYNSILNGVYDEKTESVEISYVKAFDDFDDACEEAGFDN